MLFSLALSGCGFALRGNVSVPAQLQPVFIETSRESIELKDSLKRQLAINAVKVTTRRKEAALILRMELLDQDTRSVALDNEARDAEYALFESARIMLLNIQGETLRGPRTLQQRRVIVNDPDNPVGEETESEIVRSEMLEQLSIRIAQQLEYWSKQLVETP
ncbi:LPS assembly lipoprotein LptE [Spongiibacter taiwanensis]